MRVWRLSGIAGHLRAGERRFEFIMCRIPHSHVRCEHTHTLTSRTRMYLRYCTESILGQAPPNLYRCTTRDARPAFHFVPVFSSCLRTRPHTLTNHGYTGPTTRRAPSPSPRRPLRLRAFRTRSMATPRTTRMYAMAVRVGLAVISLCVTYACASNSAPPAPGHSL